MDAPYYNGPPGPEHDPGRATGTPDRYACPDCAWIGKGRLAVSAHYLATGHCPRYVPPSASAQRWARAKALRTATHDDLARSPSDGCASATGSPRKPHPEGSRR